MFGEAPERDWMFFEKEDDHDYLITSGDVDEESNVPGMLELALEYFQKEDPESTAMAYLQSREAEEPWAVVLAADPASLLRLTMEVVQRHCPQVSVAMMDVDEDYEDFDVGDLLEDD
tara:strand:- start:3930 stop:4280 length:351 start_codon:yes stop_codon:yes gene_type:complete